MRFPSLNRHPAGSVPWSAVSAEERPFSRTFRAQLHSDGMPTC